MIILKKFPTNISEQKNLRAPISNDSPHFNFWTQLDEYCKTWQFLNSKGRKVATPTPGNVSWNISAYKTLWAELEVAGFDKLYLGLCNQDPLENAFGVIKLFASKHKTPIPPSFLSGKFILLNRILLLMRWRIYLIAGYKTFLINKLTFVSALNEGNCEDDGARLLYSDLAKLLDPNDNEIKEAVSHLKSMMIDHGMSDSNGDVIVFANSDQSTQNGNLMLLFCTHTVLMK